MKKIAVLMMSFLLVSCGSLKKERFTYKSGDTEMKGFLAYNKKVEGKRPGILVVHEWWGHNRYAKKRAKKLAKLGYVALAVDMYGDGKRADHPKEAKKFAMATLKNKAVAEARFNAALEKLKSHPMVDKDKIAAVGYCFGGGVVLHMARKGADLDAVASFHGSLKPMAKMKKGAFKGKVMVFNGAADPLVKAEDVKKFKREMKKAKADLLFVNYKNAKHSFTNPKADKVGKKFKLPLEYNKEADEDSWMKMNQELKKIFN